MNEKNIGTDVKETIPEKPITLQIKELRMNIANVLNGTDLPIYIVQAIIKDFYNDATVMLQKYTQEEIANYNNIMQREKI